MDAYLYLPQDWWQGAPKMCVFTTLVLGYCRSGTPFWDDFLNISSAISR